MNQGKEAYITNIQKKTLNNDYYRRVLFTTDEMQLVVMKLYPGEVIPRELHHNITQFIRVEQGRILVRLNDDTELLLEDDDVIIIPAETYHEVYSLGPSPASIYTIYSPPEHPPNTLQMNPPKED